MLDRYLKQEALAKGWIERNSVLNNGIVITSRQRRIYQEVTGYYIPTLLKYGMEDLAVSYARWLCRVQQPSGAWRSSDLQLENVFNTGQVLRGLSAIYEILPEVKDPMLKASEWLLSRMDENGRLVPVEGTLWAVGTNSELIHLYCLPPVQVIGKKLNIPRYDECVAKILSYYKEAYADDIVNFNYLSHFYAYVIEALADLGEVDLAGRAMRGIEKLQKRNGSVPAYRNVSWVCSTGLFQMAIIWFKLGNSERGLRAFRYAAKLQNPSGGWYGGYPASGSLIVQALLKEKISYFPDEEISWAVKYFLDALEHVRKSGEDPRGITR